MRVFFRSEKVKRNIRLIAHHPTIVPRTDVKDVSGRHDVKSSILHRACSLSRDHHTDVLHLTKGSPGNWRDVLRPSPAGLICRPTDRHSADLDKFELSFFKSANLIRVLKSFDQEVDAIRSIGLTWLALIKRLPSIDVFYYVCSRNLDHSNPAML